MKNIKNLFLFIAFIFLSVGVSFAYAEESILNAGLVSDIWFDQLNLYEDEETNVYTIFFNQSDRKIKTSASFRVGTETVSVKDFEVEKDSTYLLSFPYIPKSGKHLLSIEIMDPELNIKTKKNEENVIVKKETALGDLVKVEGVGDVLENVNTIIKNINQETEKIAQNLESKKVQNREDNKEVPQEKKENNKEEIPEESDEYRVLGMNVNRFLPANNEGVAKVYDVSIDGITWLVRNWQWGALIIFGIFVLFIRRFFR